MLFLTEHAEDYIILKEPYNETTFNKTFNCLKHKWLT